MDKYENIQPAGESTGAPRNLARRFALMQRFIDLEGRRVLDMGCGNGRYVLGFLERGADAWGVDFSEAAVREYRHAASRPERVTRGDIERLDFEDNRFDLVLLNEVLEHVPNDRAAVAEAWRVLRPGAWLMVFSPNRLHPFETHGVTLRRSGRVVPHYVPFVPYIPLSLGKRLFRYHARNYSPRELGRLVLTQPFTIEARTCIWQTFENISGSAPRPIRVLSPVLRAISLTLEKIPLIRRCGVSQVILARKVAAH